MEACASSHHWSREVQALGHTVRLVPPAYVLVSTRFRNSVTRGFAAIGEPNVAVCLLPGTEIAFERDVEWIMRTS
jgi:hypothetical protein